MVWFHISLCPHPLPLPLSEGEGEGNRKSDKGEIVFIC
ncbi:hypothetical protein HMPREF1320_2210 [Capnocytophaga sp. oral taxon 335 str. F0486]|nr:hypothetical protein HMPREF1320_2210 [Capnocytophaga sp. oral taxon 335 str. F0486]